MPTRRDPVQLFGFAGSTYVRSARMICLEKDAPFELVGLEFRADSHRALHPFAKMPAMKHGDVQLFETLAIGLYLDETFGGSLLVPTKGAGRYQVLQWLSALVDYVYRDVVGTLGKGADASEEDLARAATTLGTLDAALSKRTVGLGGEALSLADLVLFPMLAYAETQAAGTLVKHPALAAFHDAMAARPSAEGTK